MAWMAAPVALSRRAYWFTFGCGVEYEGELTSFQSCQSLIGTSELTSVMRPWSPSLIQFPIEYIVRSLFTTVLVADLFLMMNLQLWRHTKEFQASGASTSYDRLMSEIEEAGGAPQPVAPQQAA